MNKKEYAMLHYLLAKVKYELAEDLDKVTNKRIQDKNRTLINYINEIEKLIIIGE